MNRMTDRCKNITFATSLQTVIIALIIIALKVLKFQTISLFMRIKLKKDLVEQFQQIIYVTSFAKYSALLIATP